MLNSNRFNNNNNRININSNLLRIKEIQVNINSSHPIILMDNDII